MIQLAYHRAVLILGEAEVECFVEAVELLIWLYMELRPFSAKSKVQVVGDGVAAVDRLHVNALIRGYIWS